MRAALWGDQHAEDISGYFREPRDHRATYVVDRGDGRLAGFVEVGLRSYAEGCVESPVAYIEGWYVDPDVRGLGFGGTLISAAEHWARARGSREIASDCEIANDVSVEAHKALGYEEVGRSVCFRKSLDPAR